MDRYVFTFEHKAEAREVYEVVAETPDDARAKILSGEVDAFLTEVDVIDPDALKLIGDPRRG